MCTDLRLIRLPSMHVSARTLDFAIELHSQVRVVPRGQQWSAVATGTNVPTLNWTNTLCEKHMGMLLEYAHRAA